MKLIKSDTLCISLIKFNKFLVSLHDGYQHQVNFVETQRKLIMII